MADLSDCCFKGFNWDGTPQGRETTIGETASYVTGSSDDVAILVIHDVFGWTFANTRLLADHYAREAGATAYLPDLYAHSPVSGAAARRQRG